MKLRKPLLAALVAGLVATGGLLTATLVSDTSGSTAQDAPVPVPTRTASVVRQTMVSSTDVEGTLAFSSQRKLTAGGQGTFTWLPAAGSTVKRNGRLYEVDGTAVRLMYGDKPAYRTLKKGDEGADVRQLKQNLIALGFGSGLVADDEFTEGTERGVEAWQESHGLKETGTIGPEQIAFAPSAVRVQTAPATLGGRSQPGVTVLTTTSSERVVQFDLEVSEADDIGTGDVVTVRLPDGRSVKGEVSSVGRTAEVDRQSEDKTPKVKITVELDRPGRVGGIDKSPVTVTLSGERRKDVLSVPVESLLALENGGFGVRVVDDGEARDVPVELGIFADGRVEVSGGGLREGMKVGVPA
ncbi:peptidoglycan-binding protein [Streptomyces cadmiisoli]|uniref:Efflux RND transporter periplasmic adaptor subunit n=1 Tax=Streptomyces cadmiisoli TaxID=2184053 RepID=A0A2Z4JDP7_9ACTN|nr:peptidoglycan-binding protein [Streptomyces cadmiisoli]AWW43171.1 efflux RND transporter periplasmic adaptor subunit [Streptomyces cadmiisoli]